MTPERGDEVSEQRQQDDAVFLVQPPRWRLHGLLKHIIWLARVHLNHKLQ